MRTVVFLLITESILTAAVVAVAGWQFGSHHAWSAFIGGGICLLTTAYFALRVFMVKADSNVEDRAGANANQPVTGSGRQRRIEAAENTANTMVRTFYLAEGQKLVLTAVSFIAVIKLMNVAFAPLIIAYVIAHFGYWVVMLVSVNWEQPTAPSIFADTKRTVNE